MLQRKQTLWMLLVVACAVGTLKFPFFTGNRLSPNPAAAPVFQTLTATGNIFLLILTVAIIVATLVNIFNYKNRQLQLRITVALILLSLLNIFLYYLETAKFQAGSGTYSLTAILTLAIPILLVLAARGIAKDQKLVKSVDRLR